MGIVIRKQDTGEVFDLPEDFTMEVNNTSPIFNNIGSKTVPASLPRNPHNSRLLGYANRLDIVNKPTNKVRVIVSEGSYIREGVLYLNSASNTDKSFSATIAFNEGIMYEEMKSTKLTNLPNLPVVEKKYDEMIEYMNQLFHIDDLNEPLTVFPVTLKSQGIYDDEQPSGLKIKRKIFSYLNQHNRYSTDNSLLVTNKVEHLEGSEKIMIDVPMGYGLSPFVRLWKVLELAFSHFGYTIRENPFRSEFQLRRLVVLNNTIDAIVENRIKYAQLMPDVTIFELLTALFVRFGAKVFVEGNRKIVDIVLLRDILSSKVDTKLSLADVIDIEYSEPKQLKLSSAKSLDMSETETDTFEEFLSKYNNTLGKDSNLFSRSGLTWYRLHGRIYQKAVGEVTEGENPGSLNYHGKFVSSIHFDWNRQTEGIKTEEYASIDEALTMQYDSGEHLYYGIDYAMRNSRLEVNRDVRDMDVPNKLAFAFDFGEGYAGSSPETNRWGYKFGSVLPYAPYHSGTGIKPFVDKDGNTMKYALTFVGEEGCFNQFHRQHDAMLRHSNHQVKTKIDIPKFQLANMDYRKLYNISNQPLLIDKLNYIVGDFNTNELVARTTRLYQPYDLNKEQIIPPFLPINYQWKLSDNRDEMIKEILNQQTQYWEKNPVPGVSNVYYSFRDCVIDWDSIEDPEPPSDVDLWYLPPTQNQFEQQIQIGKTDHTLSVTFVVTFLHLQIGEIREYRDTRNVKYNGFFVPIEYIN